MEFFDASTLPESDRKWEPLVEPLTLPRPSILMIVLSTVVLLGAFVVLTTVVLDIVTYMTGTRIYSIPLLLIRFSMAAWLVLILIVQPIALLLRSWVFAALAFCVTLPAIFLAAAIAMLNLGDQEVVTFIGLLAFGAVVVLSTFCLLQYDWILRLRKAHRDRA